MSYSFWIFDIRYGWAIIRSNISTDIWKIASKKSSKGKIVAIIIFFYFPNVKRKRRKMNCTRNSVEKKKFCTNNANYQCKISTGNIIGY